MLGREEIDASTLQEKPFSLAHTKETEAQSSISPQETMLAPEPAPLTPQKTCAVHFLAFDLTPHTRALLASAPPVVSCLHPHALARVSMGGELWTSLVQDLCSSS